MSPIAVGALALLAVFCGEQDKKKEKDAQAEYQKRVEETIRKGVEFVKSVEFHAATHELKLLTYIHAGVPESDPEFKEVFNAAMKRAPFSTYNTALLAMCLEELDRVKYQEKIYHCAQFLLDNQLKNGQWSYGEPTSLGDLPPGKPIKAAVATPKPKKGTQASPNGPVREKPPLRLRFGVFKTRAPEKEFGDNSNSQYAALGLRACSEAGMDVPTEVLEKAREWWIKAQTNEESQNGKADVAYGDIRGWDYASKGVMEGRAYGSMTAGGVGALIIFEHLLGNDWKKSTPIQAGINWMSQNFSVTENPGGIRPYWHYYYLYALERAGVFCGSEYFGRHAWYSEGASSCWTRRSPTARGPRDMPSAAPSTIRASPSCSSSARRGR